jgi:Domain of unknown function (DUF5004)
MPIQTAPQNLSIVPKQNNNLKLINNLNMKNLILIFILTCTTTIGNAQNLGGVIKGKAKKIATSKSKEIATKPITVPGKSAPSKNVNGMQGTWKVDGVIVTTENEALKKQLEEQEKQYNDVYKGYNWVFKNDGSISITAKTPGREKAETGVGKYELSGEKIYMEINGQPGEYDLKFEDGQMLLINTSPLNTIYYVFVKG